ncbi:hypothetical protein NDI47_04470 [Microcoleus vaginatus GB1-A2]|uniref:hypothetical protein n=1 Tax=Microcoleus vaginatus TaxID=119532 RepID=UPI00168852FC|nr:hypothetical protein [Microcoleus sp. FACHB-61]
MRNFTLNHPEELFGYFTDNPHLEAFDKNYQYLFTDSTAKCIHRQAQTKILNKYKELT